MLTPEEELYPRVHHEEMFATLVARDILQYCDGGTWHYIWKWASPDSLDPAKRADEFRAPRRSGL